MQNLISVKIKEDKIISKNTTVKNPMKVITGEDTRWSYANVWEPKSINGGAPKYSVSLIIPKSDTKTVAKIKAAIEAAYTEGESKLKGNSKSVPPLTSIKTPLRDGDVERPDDPAYANAYFINANSATAPGIVDADLNPVLTRSEVYSGVYGRASITLYAFNRVRLLYRCRRRFSQLRKGAQTYGKHSYDLIPSLQHPDWMLLHRSPLLGCSRRPDGHQ